MIKFQIIKTSYVVESQNYHICRQIMADQGFKISSEIVDIPRSLRLGRGKINPTNGFVIIAPDGEAILDYVELFRYMEKTGIIRI